MGNPKYLTNKNIYIGAIALFVLSVVVLSALALQSNQATNSRAADVAKKVPLASPPSLAQQEDVSIQFEASINGERKVQLLGIAPPVTEYQIFTIYFRKVDNTFIHLDTFITNQEMLNARFNEYWDPKVVLTPEDVKNGIFYLYSVN